MYSSLKLEKGYLIRVIAPARNLTIIADNKRKLAIKRFNKLGLDVSFGAHVNENDIFDSSPVDLRIKDLHKAFGDRNVKAVFTVIGGFNSIQLLKHIDYKLIKSNPKIICGYSDITCLANAIYAKTGMITYSGPHFSTLGEKNGMQYTLDYLQKCLFSGKEFEIKPCGEWYDNNQKEKNDAYYLLNEGEAEGTIIGGNLCSLNLLQGTEFMPSLKNSILFLEDDYESHSATFDRNLQSLICLPQFSDVRGILIGRFQRRSKMTLEKLKFIIETKPELKKIPVIANVDFGHTRPMITFPIGGFAHLTAHNKKITIHIYER